MAAFLVFGLLLAAAGGLSSLPGTLAHAFLAKPPARNALHDYGFPESPVNYCKHCLFAGGTSYISKNGAVVWPAGEHGLCGDPAGQKQDHMSPGGQYANGIIAKTYTAGSDIDIEIDIDAHHMGMFQFSLCVLSDPALPNDATQACLDAHPLERADGGGRSWFLPVAPPAARATYQMTYKLPDGVTCERCVLQWYWLTGNRCNQPEWLNMSTSPGSILPGLDLCGIYGNAGLYPEEYWNCADIAITA